MVHCVKDFHPAQVRPNDNIIGVLLWIGRALLIALWMNLLPRATAPTGTAIFFSFLFVSGVDDRIRTVIESSIVGKEGDDLSMGLVLLREP